MYGADIEPSTRQLVAVVRIRVSKSCRGLPLCGIRQILINFITPSRLLEGVLYGADIKPSTRQLVAVVRQFASANFCRGLPLAGFGKFSLIL